MRMILTKEQNTASPIVQALAPHPHVQLGPSTHTHASSVALPEEQQRLLHAFKEVNHFHHVCMRVLW